MPCENRAAAVAEIERYAGTIAAATVLASVPLGTLAAYGLARTRLAGKLLFGLLTIRMFPQILLASRSSSWPAGLG